VPGLVRSKAIILKGLADLCRTELGIEVPGILYWEDVMLNETAIAALKSEFRGELIEPNDTRYDAIRKVYNCND